MTREAKCRIKFGRKRGQNTCIVQSRGYDSHVDHLSSHVVGPVVGGDIVDHAHHELSHHRAPPAAGHALCDEQG